MNTSHSLTVFIHTQEDDLHAKVIAEALRQRGHRVIAYRGDHLPERVRVALDFGSNSDSLTVKTETDHFELDRIDVLWSRRPCWSRPPGCIARADEAYVRQQNHMLEKAINALAREAFWINPWHAARSADLKPLQLQVAPRCGLRIPETLVSNDAQAIRQFLARHERVIHKPLCGVQWIEDNRVYGSYTARVTADDLPRNELVQAAPGIYQVQVDKQFEVRAQYFGASCFATQIDSGRIEYGEYDWRLHQHREAAPNSIELPAQVDAACRRFLNEMGLVAGAFDFIVSPDGQWTFLEINEAGQFLFLEDWRPELPMVDAICAFIESRDPDFIYRMPEQPLRLEELSALLPSRKTPDPAATGTPTQRRSKSGPAATVRTEAI